MTNFEKYKEELLSFISNHRSTPAMIDGAFVSCTVSYVKIVSIMVLVPVL